MEGLLFDIEEIDSRMSSDKDPYQNVFMQEIELMNMLMQKIIASCRDLDLGFKGELTMTEEMDGIVDSLVLDKVPATW